jgi:hypothetical protein
MTEVRMTLTTSPDERLDASAAMLGRVIGVERRLIILGIAIPLALAGGMGIAGLMGYPLVAAGIVALYTLVGGMIGMSIAYRLQARRIRSLFSASNLLSKSQSVSLSETGLCLEARTLPWSAITAQSRCKNTTLLQFSSTDALVIPDRDLPVGLSPEDLQAQVAKWLRS